MKILKKLFGKSDVKIHVDEIADSNKRLLGSSVIVAEGSNANGQWIKFGDGTMICQTRLTLGPISGATGALFQSENIQWTYPQKFIDSKVMLEGFVQYGTAGAWIASSSTNSNESMCVFRLMCSISAASTNIGTNLVAHGRWKE